MLPSSLIDLFLVFVAFGVGNTAGWVFYLLGMQLWSFWKARNDLLFSSRLFEVDQQVDTIILHF